MNSMLDFRPISCCSVVYKAITKIIANMMQAVYLDIISKNQNAFIKGRSITDNILLTQKLVRGYNRRSLSLRCALKVNLKKAFDSIHWSFIFKILRNLNFP